MGSFEATVWHQPPKDDHGGLQANCPPQDTTEHLLPEPLRKHLQVLLNIANRHSHSVSYCLRRINGVVKCRFNFPQKGREPNAPHFYCERVKSGIRWRLYLPMNDVADGFD